MHSFGYNYRRVPKSQRSDDRLNPFVFWTLTGIAIFGMVVTASAFVLTFLQGVACLLGLWP